MNRKLNKVLSTLCAATILVAALFIPASAASTTSVADQMAANSAAWAIANAAGDKATCDALHAANVALANQAAGSSGSATFNSASGTWNITTSSGSNISSASSGSTGKSGNITYTTTTSSGSRTTTTDHSYSSSSIDAYYQYGGTNTGLNTAYNNAAEQVYQTGSYGDSVTGRLDAQRGAETEAAVAQRLLGLSNKETAELSAKLLNAKQDYIAASDAYDAAVAAGDTKAAAAAKAAMAEAHDAAETARGSYGYTGDNDHNADGGSYYDDPSGKTSSGSGGSFYVTDITATYKITASCNEGGSITPNGTVIVKKGDNQKFEIAPNEGYQISKVLVDGTDQGKVTSYTFTKVNTAHTIAATFEKKSFDITASCGTGGTISPNGKSTVKYGESKTFTITPSDGYDIADVVVDGVSKGAVKTYTFSDVKEAHTIKATFQANGKVEIGTLTVTDTLGTDLSGDSIKSGYGIKVSVPVSATGVSGVKVTMAYNFGDGTKNVTLQKSGGSYVLPINTASKTLARCVYIPVATADGTYTLTVTVTATNAAGETVSDTSTATVTVLGSMYEDDFTGDS